MAFQNTYLVTGGAGFIGSHLVERLMTDGHKVRILDDFSTGMHHNLPPGVELIDGDIANYSIVNSAMEGVNGCFHLAAISSVEQARLDWIRCNTVNLSGTVNIFAAACCRDIPVVYASSAAVYGMQSQLPLHEDLPVQPVSIYGADKLGCELQANAAAHSYGLRSTGIRIFNCYGPRQRADSQYAGVISLFCDLLSKNKPIRIHGDGTQTRDFIYVKDVVDIFILAMEKLRAGSKLSVVNACTGKQTSIIELVEMISCVFKISPEIYYEQQRVGDIPYSAGATKRIGETLRWKPNITLQNGLCDLIKHLGFSSS